MKRTPITIAAVAVVALAGIAAGNMVPGASAGTAAGAQTRTVATEQTVTFAVEKMTCAACPITVRKAMQKVEGVKSVDVDFAAKTATVVFDPSVTTPERIGAASTNAGYPATQTR
ncbi:MAG: heavy-metal-associated domain-containing protein [Alphaproteobacteria bacterium]|nr:MAG: heavy-metal-associated domain-containing protein [Alphaproteobacteria bacterium]